MGIYTIPCSGCSKNFSWFSGAADQFCEDCKKPKGSVMNESNKEIEYLNQIIKLQNDMIEMLKAEIGRIKITTIQSPLHNPGPFTGSGYPVNPNPFVPNPGLPINPYVITCGDPTPPGAGGTGMIKESGIAK